MDFALFLGNPTPDLACQPQWISKVRAQDERTLSVAKIFRCSLCLPASTILHKGRDKMLGNMKTWTMRQLVVADSYSCSILSLTSGLTSRHFCQLWFLPLERKLRSFTPEFDSQCAERRFQKFKVKAGLWRLCGFEWWSCERKIWYSQILCLLCYLFQLTQVSKAVFWGKKLSVKVSFWYSALCLSRTISIGEVWKTLMQ